MRGVHSLTLFLKIFYQCLWFKWKEFGHSESISLGCLGCLVAWLVVLLICLTYWLLGDHSTLSGRQCLGFQCIQAHRLEMKCKNNNHKENKQTKKMMFTAWKYLCEQKNRETLHPSSWGKEDKSQEKGLLRPSQSMCPSRQSWAAVQLSRTECDFNMRFCSLGFSNQKATAFCTVCLLCLSQGSGKELACIRNLLCITLRLAPSARHHLYLLCPRHFRVCWKGSGEGKESGEVEAETEWVRNLNYINCFCT